MEKLLTPSQVAEILGVKPQTIYTWIHRGIDIPHVKISGTIRFFEGSVKEWLLKKELERKKRNFE